MDNPSNLMDSPSNSTDSNPMASNRRTSPMFVLNRPSFLCLTMQSELEPT